VGYSTSATTRAPRPDERDGVDYHFLARDEFARRREAGAFAEWAEYNGELYGTLQSELARITGAGQHAILDIDLEGSRQLRRTVPGSVHVFVLPPTAAALAARLRGRNSETAAQVRRRLERAAAEIAAAREYDYIIVNDDLDDAVRQVESIIDAERHRVHRRGGLGDELDRLQRDVEREATGNTTANAGA
jgi:guanylate kinase